MTFKKLLSFCLIVAVAKAELIRVSPGAIRLGDGTDIDVNVETQENIRAMVIEYLDKVLEEPHDYNHVAQAIKDYFQTVDLSKVTQAWVDTYEEYLATTAGEARFFDCPSCYIIFNFEAIWGYGCWCIFGNDGFATTAGGQVQDTADAICKDLQLCYRCAALDSKKEGKGVCNAFAQTYDFTVLINLISTPMFGMQCNDPADTCEHRACTCDGGFIEALLTTTVVVDTSKQHQDDNNNPVFDFATECVVTETHSVRDCCGSYPDRRPYNMGMGSSMACCNNVSIYNSDYLGCCANGSVVASGNPCPP